MKTETRCSNCLTRITGYPDFEAGGIRLCYPCNCGRMAAEARRKKALQEIRDEAAKSGGPTAAEDRALLESFRRLGKAAENFAGARQIIADSDIVIDDAGRIVKDRCDHLRKGAFLVVVASWDLGDGRREYLIQDTPRPPDNVAPHLALGVSMFCQSCGGLVEHKQGCRYSTAPVKVKPEGPPNLTFKGTEEPKPELPGARLERCARELREEGWVVLSPSGAGEDEIARARRILRRYGYCVLGAGHSWANESGGVFLGPKEDLFHAPPIVLHIDKRAKVDYTELRDLIRDILRRWGGRS
jgi:hypothetical protein